MADPHYPTVDKDFFINLIERHPKVMPDSKIEVGRTISYTMIGNRALHRRNIVIRETKEGGYPFEIATSVGIKLGTEFMGELLNWWAENKKWKDGAYIGPEPPRDNSENRNDL